MGKKFKCKDEVIYRFKGGAGLGDPDPWIYGIFSHYKEDGDIVVNGNCYKEMLTDILPYEGNENLVGTSDEPVEEVRLEEGEWVIGFTISNELKLANFLSIRPVYNDFVVESFDGFKRKIDKIVKFSDFNPNDMEETKSKILCVKNGKIIRYKG